MENVLIAVLSGGGVTLFIVAYVVVILVTNPEKIEKWASILNKMLTGFGGIFKSAHRNYVKYDLQSRVNSFTREVSKTAPYLEDTKISIEWTDTTSDPKTFLKNGKAILRLRRDDPEDLNFVHGAYWSVSTRLLPKAKRYISPSQRQSLDLYVTSKLIEREKFAVIEYFLEHYLHPQAGVDGKISDLFAKFAKIDKYGVFYPILLQELYFLSLKVYGGPKKDQLIIEVTRLIEFLEHVASRSVGAEMKLDFIGEYSKFGIVIVGTGYKMAYEGSKPYINYVEHALRPKNVETIYVLGKSDYRVFIDEVCQSLPSGYEIYKSHTYEGQIVGWDGKQSLSVKQYLIVLRLANTPIYQPNGS